MQSINSGWRRHGWRTFGVAQPPMAEGYSHRQNLTHDTAVLSPNALKNTLLGKSRGKGPPMRTTCEAGSVNDDMLLLAMAGKTPTPIPA